MVSLKILWGEISPINSSKINTSHGIRNLALEEFVIKVTNYITQNSLLAKVIWINIRSQRPCIHKDWCLVPRCSYAKVKFRVITVYFCILGMPEKKCYLCMIIQLVFFDLQLFNLAWSVKSKVSYFTGVYTWYLFMSDMWFHFCYVSIPMNEGRKCTQTI